MVLSVLLAGLLAGCGGSGSTEPQAAPGQAAPAAPAPAPATPAAGPAAPDELSVALTGLSGAVGALQTDAAVKAAGDALAGPRAQLAASQAAARAALKATYAERDRDDSACGAIGSRRDEVSTHVRQGLTAAEQTSAAGQALAASATGLSERVVQVQAQIDQTRALLPRDPGRTSELNALVTSVQGLTALAASSGATAKEAVDGAASATQKLPLLLSEAERVSDACLRRAARD